MTTKTQGPKTYGMQEKQFRREIDSNSVSPQETRKISNKQSNPTLKTTRERRTKKTQSQQKERNHKDQSRKPKVSRRKAIIKIRAEVNEVETKNTRAKINKTKSWFFEKMNKIDKPLARLIKKKSERTKINKVRNEKDKLQLTVQKYKGL